MDRKKIQTKYVENNLVILIHVLKIKRKVVK